MLKGKIMETILIAVGVAYGLSAVWGFVIPIEEGILRQLIELLFGLLPGFAFGVKYLRYVAKKNAVSGKVSVSAL